MSKGALIATLIALAAVSVYFVERSNNTVAFELWKQEFGAEFALGEEAYRRFIFEKNYIDMIDHNADDSQTYKKGINQFSIYTDEEFKLRFLTEMIIPAELDTLVIEDVEEASDTPNAEIDWTLHGGVSPIKNQGQCGSCWAFSASGVTESWSLLKGKKTVSLSEQQLVDCSTSEGNHGCKGGWPSNGLKHAAQHGWASESEYPYTAKDGSCRNTGGSFKIGAYANTAQSCVAMQNQITSAPLSVTVDATNWSRYSSGEFSNCGTGINHAVLLVGVSTTSWKIKNSWGTGWGEKGFIRLANVGKNTCGVCTYGGVYYK